MRKVILSLANLWLLWLGMIIFATRFNKYDWTDPPMLDCDTDAEAAFMLMAWLVWLTTAIIAMWFAGSRKAISKNFEAVTLFIAILISIGTAVKYGALLDYNEEIAGKCAESSDT